MIHNFLIESLNDIEGINKIQHKLQDTLLRPAKIPKGTAALYFSASELSRIVTKFLDIKKKFIELDLFKDEFDRCNYFKVSELDTLTLIEHNLMLWDLNYESLFATLKYEINDLTERIKRAPLNWYNKHAYLINNETYIDKKYFSIYRIVDKNWDTLTITLECCKYSTHSKSLSIDIVKIKCDSIRDIYQEQFLSEEIGKIYPEWFL